MPNQAESKIRVRVGEVDSICLYQVTDSELEILEKGSPSSLYLNFSMFFLSTGISFLISIWLTEISSYRTFTVFVIITIVSFVAGIITAALWFRDYNSSKNIVKKIKDRLKEEALPAVSEGDSTKPAN